MNFDEAATAITAALVAGGEFSTVTIDGAGSVTPDALTDRDAVIAPRHYAGAERIADGLRMVASRLRPADELVSVTRDELRIWFEGRDGLEEATPRCDRCLVPLELHPTAEAWVCPSCGAVCLA